MNFPESIKISEGVNLYFIKTDKFKTFSVHLFFHRPLDGNVTKNALIPLVLRRGSEKFPSMRDISIHLEELYGASFDCGVSKKGERHILRFHLESIYNEKLKEEKIVEKSIEFLSSVVLNPVLDNGIFDEEYVKQEKENLEKIIDSKVNDKSKYSLERCIEEMCKDEPYSIYEYGNIEDLEAIDAANLYEYYKNILKTSPLDIFVVGNLQQEELVKSIKESFNFDRQNIISISETGIRSDVGQTKNIEEEMDVNQGKLCIGFRTNTPYEDNEYFDLIVYNSILGGGTTSKLFINVREKASLAYSTGSRIDKFKGLMFVTAGIDFANYNKAVEIIMKQLDEMKAGNVSEVEYNSAISSLTTSIQSLSDTHIYIVDFFLSQIISNSHYTFEEVIDKIRNVRKENLKKVSERLKLDTIYFLKGKSSEGR